MSTTSATNAPMDDEPIAVQASIQTTHLEVSARRMRRQPDGTWIEGDFPLSAFEEEQA